MIGMPLISPDVEPLWIAHYDYKPGASLPEHAHPDHFQLIVVMKNGGGQVIVDGKCFPLGTGQLLFFPPGRKHGLQASGGQPVCTLDTKFKIRHRSLAAACRRIEPIHASFDRRILALLEAIHAEAQHVDAFSAEVCRTLLAQALLLLLRGKPGELTALPTGPDPDETGARLPQRLHRFLRDHGAETITQKTLSRSFCYSYHHLHAVYRQRYGESPLRALKRMRVERAMQLIRYADYGLKHVAKASGFATVHHFTRVFTSVAGISPARWRTRNCRQTQRDVVIHPGFVNQDLVRSR